MASISFKDSLISGSGSGDQAIQVDKLPIPAERLLGTIYQFIGEDIITDEYKYINGFFYKCKEVSSDDGEISYKWESISVQPAVSIDGNTLVTRDELDNHIKNTAHKNREQLNKIGEDDNGNLTYNGETIKAGEIKSDEIVNDDGTKISTINLGGVTVETIYDKDGNVISTKIGDIIVKGSITSTNTETITNEDGNTVNTTTTITSTPDGKTTTITIETINSETGEKIIKETVTSGNYSGTGLGVRSITTTKKDSEGNETEKTTETNLINNGENIYLTKDEVDSMFNAIEW